MSLTWWKKLCYNKCHFFHTKTKVSSGTWFPSYTDSVSTGRRKTRLKKGVFAALGIPIWRYEPVTCRLCWRRRKRTSAGSSRRPDVGSTRYQSQSAAPSAAKTRPNPDAQPSPSPPTDKADRSTARNCAGCLSASHGTNRFLGGTRSRSCKGRNANKIALQMWQVNGQYAFDRRIIGRATYTVGWHNPVQCVNYNH